MVVSMFAQRAVLRGLLAYERVAWTAQSRRWKPMTRKRTLEANDSQEDLVVSRSNHGEVFRFESPTSHTRTAGSPSRQFSAFIRTFRLNEAVVLSYNSRSNRLRHSGMRRIRRSIWIERSTFSPIMPPRYKNWAVYFCLWPTLLMTSGGARAVWSVWCS